MHLKESFVKWGQIVGHDTVVGLLGKTGNAAKTPAHMHYTILTPVPHFRLYDKVYGNGPAVGQIQLEENVLSQS